MKDRRNTIDIQELAWCKSSYSSGEGGQCVEVAAQSCSVHVRDSKDTARPPLSFGHDQWASFVAYTRKA
ncbi:DUF397 domain-containing protein [Streptomyces sp. DH12]|uniref:DUF397 domain-containing protein n=1 Tax=Streptomyces sp. DH12 TaxID=2857010 RepID=UPI001E55F239|nr:DUF397 domain-containing protein [Streptomyces sp. DH12]